MILQRLAEHYDRIATTGNEEAQLAPPGYSRQKISFCIVLEPDGRLNQFKSLQEKVGKALLATPMTVPGQGKPSGQNLLSLGQCLLSAGMEFGPGQDRESSTGFRGISQQAS